MRGGIAVWRRVMAGNGPGPRLMKVAMPDDCPERTYSHLRDLAGSTVLISTLRCASWADSAEMHLHHESRAYGGVER
jgi:hypothetical protein